MPFLSVTLIVFEPTNVTLVTSLFRPGPLRRKLWMFDLSATLSVYLPGLSFVTFFAPCLRLIVKPGPTVPLRAVAAEDASETGTATASAVTTAAVISRSRVMVLLLGSADGGSGRISRVPFDGSPAANRWR